MASRDSSHQHAASYRDEWWIVLADSFAHNLEEGLQITVENAPTLLQGKNDPDFGPELLPI